MIQKRRMVLAVVALTVFATSCSTQKKISRRPAKELLNSSALTAAHTGISIVDANTGKAVYNYQSDKYFVPASNTKIATCYVAMKYLGDSLPALRYQLINDTAVLIAGTGDPTLLHPAFKSQPVYDFLRNYKHIVLSDPLYADFLGSGWSWNDYRESYMAKRSPLPVYGNTVRFTLETNGEIGVAPAALRENVDFSGVLKGQPFEVEKGWDENRFYLIRGENKKAETPFTPVPGLVASLLADTLRRTVNVDHMFGAPKGRLLKSRPVDSLLQPLMYNSDNFFAEQALLMTGQQLLGEMKDDAVINHILQNDFKDLPQKPRWVDGSGLSRYNLFTPSDIVAILSKISKEIGMERVKNVFPTGGKGTLGSYYKELEGNLFAKTGTLSGVVCISGYFTTDKGKELIFSVLVNNHHGSATDIRRAIEKFILDIYKNY